MDYVSLKTEITTDPKTLGYAGQTDQWVADKLNEVGAGGDTAFNDAIPSVSIINAIDPTEWAALSALERERLQLLVSAQIIDISKTNVKNSFTAMFGAGTTTRSNILALVNKSISRAQALGFGKVEYWDVARARAIKTV